MKEAQELKEPTEQYFAQPLEVSDFIAFFTFLVIKPALSKQTEGASLNVASSGINR